MQRSSATTTTKLFIPPGLVITNITANGTNVTLRWQGSGNVQVQQTTDLATWVDIGTATSGNSITFPQVEPAAWYRLKLLPPQTSTGPQWATRLSVNEPGGGFTYAAAYSVTTAGDGTSYACGSANPYGGQNAMFIAKVSPAGEQLWYRWFGGRSEARDIAIDSSGNVIITGFYYGSVSFDGHSHTANAYGDIFVVKLSASDGSYVWSTTFGGTSPVIFDEESGQGIATDSNGSVYVCGAFTGNMTVGHSDFPGSTGSVALTALGGTEDIFLVKFLADGSVSWAKAFGSAGSTEIANGVAVDASDNVYMTGGFQNTVDFSQGTGTPLAAPGAAVTIFTAKFSASGTSLNSVALPNASGEKAQGSRIKIDGSGNVNIIAPFKGTVAVGANTFTSNGDFEDVLVAQLTSTLEPKWGFACGSTGPDTPFGLTMLPNGTIAVCGIFARTMAVGNSISLTPVGLRDMFIIGLDSSGSPIWANNYGTPEGVTSARRISSDSAGNTYVGMIYTGGVTFSPTVSLPAPTDHAVNGALLKLSP